MNFQTMNKQRKFILIASVAGIIAMFLPWIDIFFINVNGMHGRGILVFVCFLACAIVSVMGDQKINLDKTMWMVTLIVGGLAALIMIITFFDAASSVFTYGFYLALLASLGIVLAAYFFRTPGQNIKDGFDSLKKDIGDKTRSNKP
ncbi:MAG: hypothetical protein ABIN36_03720 [Ferruginibacter sp.]